MDITGNIQRNLIRRAYSYLESGYFVYEAWKEQMVAFLKALNNELLGWGEQDIHDIIDNAWKSDFTNEGVTRSISEWASEISKSTKIQTEMRNSMDKLFHTIENYRRSDYFKNLLDFCARFKDLAPYNALMVKTQMPDAKYVLTEKQWKERYNRAPKRNARPLVILRKYGPVSYVYEIGDTESVGQQTLFGLSTEKEILENLSHPFQTSGIIDEQLYQNLTKSLAYYGIALETFRAASDFGAEIIRSKCKVKVKDIETTGYYVISVNDKSDKNTAFASICHELGHFFCRHLPPPYQDSDNWWKMRRPQWTTREFEAEIVSFIICERYGVGNKSWEYLSSVLGRSSSIPEDISIERVFKAANEVERMLDENLDPRSCLLYNADKTFRKEFNRKYPHQKRNQETEDEG